MAKETIRKRFDVSVSSSGELVKGDFELDKNVTGITGALLTADLEAKLYHRGTFRLLIGGEEIFPDGYHAKLLMSGLGVDPSNRYHFLNFDPGNGVVRLEVTDNTHPTEAFSAYTVSMYLQLEVER